MGGFGSFKLCVERAYLHLQLLALDTLRPRLCLHSVALRLDLIHRILVHCTHHALFSGEATRLLSSHLELSGETFHFLGSFIQLRLHALQLLDRRCRLFPKRLELLGSHT